MSKQMQRARFIRRRHQQILEDVEKLKYEATAHQDSKTHRSFPKWFCLYGIYMSCAFLFRILVLFVLVRSYHYMYNHYMIHHIHQMRFTVPHMEVLLFEYLVFPSFVVGVIMHSIGSIFDSWTYAKLLDDEPKTVHAMTEQMKRRFEAHMFRLNGLTEEFEYNVMASAKMIRKTKEDNIRIRKGFVKKVWISKKV
ncbi:hypothetical protein EJ05DRAFT_478959 [Pseudovirgaria hyperparasitica]|uniref:Uncharacterized protein n=1 Tax=Pseudovirgaria hyperparasitica TaxID=470096 RepID=A0A6A6VX31_9PEZI|nr:uncharacterized protein EJ05DRAFT_478959 [Pseudovirgaria hyperparasitica]KAF2755152.1 hypothetical protein EJ05DRAFT_478959 [Pseudovirgaria hyperparasitica]